MKTASPLRYPGGKAAMAGLLGEIRRLNGLGNRSMAEPFAGGAGASLTMLYLEEAHNIYINDADPAIYDFWWALINRSRLFLDMLSNTPINIDEWQSQRDVYRSRRRTGRLRRGFSVFYLNRCNRSGIVMNGGPIGGFSQAGRWRLDARFNKAELRRRCDKVAEYRNRIHISCSDGIDFIESLDPECTFFFIDPPYFEKGPTLYLNALDTEYHEALAERMKGIQQSAWVLTYDNHPAVRKMYADWAAIHPFSLRYSAAERRFGKEICITPKWMRLPEQQKSTALSW